MAIVENMPEVRGTRNMWNMRHSPKGLSGGTTNTPRKKNVTLRSEGDIVQFCVMV